MIAQRPIDRAVPPTHVMGVARFERFFRAAAGVNVDKEKKMLSDAIASKKGRRAWARRRGTPAG